MLVLGDTLYVASDLRTWKGFKTIHNFDNAGPNGLIYRDARPVDLVFEPGNPQVLYAAFWQVQRYPWGFESGGQSRAVRLGTRRPARPMRR